MDPKKQEQQGIQNETLHFDDELPRSMIDRYIQMLNDNKSGRSNSKTLILDACVYDSIISQSKPEMCERIVDSIFNGKIRGRSSQFIVLPCLHDEDHWRVFAFDLANETTQLIDSRTLPDNSNQVDFKLIKDVFLSYWFINDTIEKEYNSKKHFTTFNKSTQTKILKAALRKSEKFTSLKTIEVSEDIVGFSSSAFMCFALDRLKNFGMHVNTEYASDKAVYQEQILKLKAEIIAELQNDEMEKKEQE